jgi:hypothetical protein
MRCNAGFRQLEHINFGEITMTTYEQQILNTEKFYDQAIKAAEQEGLEILTSVVPGSRLHEVINNTVDSGIDEG